MIFRPLYENEKAKYNSVVHHPLQSWEWGEFRRSIGVEVERLGVFVGEKLQHGIQVTFHQVPKLGWQIGYFPRGYMPDSDQLSILKQIGKKHGAIFIKLEPNVVQSLSRVSAHDKISNYLLENGCKFGRPLFTKYTFRLDLTNSEEKILKGMKSKTRYNLRLAQKKGVRVVENTTLEGMENYITILGETTKRQGFYAHTPDYFRKMWQSLGKSGILRIFQAEYQDQVLASWIVFVFGESLYYPYGASRSIHREVMASNLMMWELIKFGKSKQLKIFDMWGALGPDADKSNKWFGFHKFKEGYGGDLSEFVGTFDLVLNPPLYSIFKIGESLRWKLLRLKAKLRR